MKLLNTSEAAERLNVTAIRIRQLINEERLPAEKVGRDYVIREADLKLVENRPTGRPKKKGGTDKKK